MSKPLETDELTPEEKARAVSLALEVMDLHRLLDSAIWEDHSACGYVLAMELTDEERDFLRRFAALCQRERAGREKVC